MPKQLQERETFIRKKNVRIPGFNIGSIMRNKTVDGDIGIEVEVEGNKFPKSSASPHGAVASELIPPMWVYHHDGSLRGHDNAEYVFKKPLKFEGVKDAIDALWAMFTKYGSKLDESNRTSVHVHLNAQKWHLNRLCAFAALYFSIEELLTEWCGDHRVGNLFCLRAKDAPGVISKLKAFIQNDAETSLSEGLHYAGLNVHALCKFGSIEIRALRGCTNPGTILDWVSILERLYKMSAEYPDPRGICENFSGEGPMAYLYTVLGDKAQIVKDGINWDNQKIMDSLYEGIRLAQDLCYCREWSEYEPMEIGKDPFSRDIKKVAHSLTTEAEYIQAMTQAFVVDPAPSVGWTPAGPPMPTIAQAQVEEYYEPEPDYYEDAFYIPDFDDDDEE